MIRVEFTRAFDALSWAHEMLRNATWLNTMREHGVPVVGRLAFSGVERGTLAFLHDYGSETYTFTFAEPGEQDGAAFQKTHDKDGIRVFKSGAHLPPKADSEDLW